MGTMGTVSEVWSGLQEMLPDPDDFFAYDTVKMVRVLDRRLGQVYYLVFGVILVYVFGWVILVKKMYLDEEKSQGWILTKVSNPQASLSHPGEMWDTFDRITNPSEQGAVFIPTRILATKGQTQDDVFCESPLHNCSSNEECDIGEPDLQRAECVNNHCMRRQWCPAEDPNAPTTETHLLEFEKVDLWFQTYLHFHKFMLDLSTAGEKKQKHAPHPGANTYKLYDLIRGNNPDPLAIVENGAVIQLSAEFNCELDQHTCKMNVETVNVDTVTGFNHVHNYYYVEDGVRKRDTYRMFGIRLFTFATGFGKKTSLSQIMLQISSCISLLQVAEITADALMTNVVPERNYYYQQKVEKTEDFNEEANK